jgi:hypothetical protein
MSVGTGRVSLEKRSHMVVNREFLPLLEEAGMTDFGTVFDFQGGTLHKRIKARSVVRIDLGSPSSPHTFYLKRHVAVRPKLGELLLGNSLSPGMMEFKNLCEFRKNGIATPTPVAAGQRRCASLRYESFLITESFEPYIALEQLIRNSPSKLAERSGQIRKNRAIKAIAQLARKMHTAGFNHRDFNATHVLLGPENDTGEFPLGVFDLQHVDRKWWMRFHWMIKTMAELVYTMPAPLFSDRDHRHLFAAYTDRSLQGCRHRFIWWWITKKVRRIARHTENIRRRREKLIAEEQKIKFR